MLEQGLIQPVQAEWSSNIVLVRKQDQNWRFCLDYRNLNEKTRKDVFPLPRIDVCLDSLAKAVWYSTLDLRSGYYQVPLRPEDAVKTTFISRTGSYCWKVMPMGLWNAASSFQRLMNYVLAGLNYHLCLVYLDDTVVYSSSIDEHLERLGAVFERIRQAGLKLRPDKCKLLQEEVKFLGHVISAAGIQVESSKVVAVQQWGTPKKLKDVRAFIGLCSY